ncbi:MAG: hypothetical protein HC834_07865 [Rhodospirillales bacterium]|nr:hypothetical protein [Rhodospirillales bacterium]
MPIPQSPDASPAVEEEGFIWPVSGDVISTFGPKGDGLRNDGINIAAAQGAPVEKMSGLISLQGRQ